MPEFTRGTVVAFVAMISGALIGLDVTRSPDTIVPRVAEPASENAPAFQVAASSLRIGTRTLHLPVKPQAVEAWLGKPSRFIGGSRQLGGLLIWDDLGLVAYESAVPHRITAIAVYLARMADRDFCPRKPFVGALSVASSPVSAESTLEQVGKALLADGATHVSRLAFGVWTLAYGDVHVSLEQIDSPTLQTVTIQASSSANLSSRR
jgi:hypothetical protein